jgi:hypothetical protein
MEYLRSVKQLLGFLDISSQNAYNVVANCRKGIPMPFLGRNCILGILMPSILLPSILMLGTLMPDILVPFSAAVEYVAHGHLPKTIQSLPVH